MERRIVELGVGDVDLVEGLWKEMVEHHQAVIEGQWPGRDPEQAWRMRRAQYVGWLEANEGFLLLALGEGAEQAPLGYAFLRVGASPPTVDLGDRIGDLESLSVSAAARGEGIGTLLIEHCRGLLRAAGVDYWGVTAVAANVDAIRLYEREGFAIASHNMLAPLR
ncbi:MAG: GNAT family N-acetyltransferase [Actinobacteria bacterium]|nr:GNAT family N-acetyltransferase [Actinomycetota bacterium]